MELGSVAKSAACLSEPASDSSLAAVPIPQILTQRSAPPPYLDVAVSKMPGPNIAAETGHLSSVSLQPWRDLAVAPSHYAVIT